MVMFQLIQNQDNTKALNDTKAFTRYFITPCLIQKKKCANVTNHEGTYSCTVVHLQHSTIQSKYPGIIIGL